MSNSMEDDDAPSKPNIKIYIHDRLSTKPKPSARHPKETIDDNYFSGKQSLDNDFNSFRIDKDHVDH
jgi:Zn-dependent metalloprotease